jgi:peroxisomal membrane protein 4
VLSSLQGLSNGFTYGAKVRFTHSLVIAILFSKESLKKKIERIITNTLDHGKRLGLFVFLFKSFVCVLNRLRGQAASSHHFVAGLIASFIVWREENNINTQITLYLLSRILVGGAKVLYAKLGVKNAFLEGYGVSILTLLSWASSMFLFDYDRNVLQFSMSNSMKFLYLESNDWKGWKECVFGTFSKLFKN